MEETRHRACICGAVYNRTESMAAERQISSFECSVCDQTMESWNTAWVPSYRLIAGPVRPLQISQEHFGFLTFDVVMKRYFFDLRDGDELTRDDEGLELSTMQAVQEEAARPLADMARDASRRPHNGAGHRMAITGPVLRAKFTFQIERVKH